MLKEALVIDRALPARSIAEPLTVWLGPSLLTIWSGGHVATLEPESEHEKCAVTGVLFHPLAFAPGASVASSVGATVSMLIPFRVAAPTFPAKSLACPVADRLVPSVERITGDVSVPGATPDNASTAVNVNVT